MLRALKFLGIVSAIIIGAAWLVQHPGRVSLDLDAWGYRIDAPFSLFVFAVLAVAVVTAITYRIWIFLRRAPGQVTGAWRDKRRRQGYQALTKGMVAVAAGDADEADRQTKRAEVLLNDPPLTMLLAAQAAQLKGDETAAETFFKSMADDPETEFLGLRGLMIQAVKHEDSEEALRIARRAYRLRPKSEWVATNLFEMQTRQGLWLDARVTNEDLLRGGLVGREEAQRRKAVLAHQMGVEARGDGDFEHALKQFRLAADLEPTFVAAVADYADALVRAGRGRKAATAVEKAWASAPHLSLLSVYWRAQKAETALDRVRATERLVKANPEDKESRIALARAGLDAELWGEARKNLEALSGDDGACREARVCRLWAELEERELGDMAKVREWLVRASMADEDSVWVCSSCGNTVPDWAALCGNCESFDSFTWRTPPHVTRLPKNTAQGNLPALIPGTPEGGAAGA